MLPVPVGHSSDFLVLKLFVHVNIVNSSHSEVELAVMSNPEKNCGNFTVSRAETTLPQTSTINYHLN